ncbi:hypothetical protein KM043_014515 [Ampulex compressa]|nr:hypothetical protein KM043_014515 [Ampulex compressa]
MNNPYRARPSRSRMDPMAGYGAYNQNTWAPIPRAQQDIPQNESLQHRPPIVNQTKQTNDPWSDSWNWNVDQQTETQQQQQQQQQHYASTFPNQGQLISNSVQDHPCQTINGGKADMVNQNVTLARKDTGLLGNRQSMQNHTEAFAPYSNYAQNQQYPIQARTISAKPGTIGFEHSRQLNDPHLQNLPYVQQETRVQGQNEQVSHPTLVSNNYNWNKTDRSNLVTQHTWPNHTEVAGQWPDSNPVKEIHLDSMGNQCPAPSPQVQPPHTFVGSNDGTNNEHSINWSNGKQGSNSVNSWSDQNNIPTTQWHNQNREASMTNQSQHPAQIFNSEDKVNSWPQSPNMDLTQDWKAAKDMNPSQWVQQPDPVEENVLQDANGTRSTASEWQQSHVSLQHTLPTLMESAVSASHVEQQEDRRNSLTSPIGKIALQNEPVAHIATSTAKPQHSDHQNTVTDMTSKSRNFENIPVEENEDVGLPAESVEWKRNDLTEDVSTNLGQLSLGNKTEVHLENQKEVSEIHSTVPTETWSQQSSTGYNINNSYSNNTPGNTPVLPSNYLPTALENFHSVDSQPVVSQLDVNQMVSNTYSMANVKLPEPVSQSGYDQWYNQNTIPLSENMWHPKDHAQPLKQWNTEQNVENCENIQQPSEFVNLEVVTPSLQERDIYGSRDSINKETLDNEPKPVINSKEVTSVREFRQEINNIEVPSVQPQVRSHQPLQPEQAPDNYEFASNDRNTFLETGELTDSHQDHEPTPPSQDDENDEVPNDIPFLREVPGQSSSIDPRRNDPTGQEQYIQAGQRLADPRRNDPSGQEQSIQARNLTDRSERRDVPPGQERNVPLLSRTDSDPLERRNDPSGRERSLPPQQSRNDPSGEERYQSQSQIMLEPSETREVPGRGNESEDSTQQTDGSLRQIPGGASPNEVVQSSDDRSNGRVVTGSQEVPSTIPAVQDPAADTRHKREEAVGASVGESQGVSSVSNRRDSYEEGDHEGSGNSREDSRERRRDNSPERRRYEYDRKGAYYDRDREYEDDYYYDRRRVGEADRPYNSREEFERREVLYREDDRKHHSRDELDRHARDEVDRRSRSKDELDERDGRRRMDDRRRERGEDSRHREREIRDYDSRYARDREYHERDRRRDDRRPRRYEDYDIRDPYRREYYDDPYGRNSRPSSRSSYNDRDREYYMRMRNPYYAYNGYGGYEYGAHYGNNYYAYLENLRRTNPAAYTEWYHKYYSGQHQQQHMARTVGTYPEDRASVHSGRSSCDERTVDKRTIGDMALLEDSAIAFMRVTPTLFSTSHTYGCFSIGSLVHVLPSYPADGERAKVDIFRVDNLLSHDTLTRDLRAYPGPLIKGVTHKKTIIEYCENKIKKAAANEEMIDRASYILLYELMIMLIQQNGNVVGVDIAALLLRNKEAYPCETIKQKSQETGRRESVISQRSATLDGSNQDITTITDKEEISKPRKTVEQMTDEFRNTLLYGLVQEALEYAMNEGLWGHALFLASKLDKRTHASVMTRFANSLPPQDPLQTLYQLHSGRVPSIVTCVSDPRWDDWRPHLAMIISNTSANPEVNRRSITTLGDTLSARGNINAAHFCYILAQIDFGAYGTNGVKLVLIGTNHQKSYAEFLTTEAVMLTEIYEYARNLSEPGFRLVDLQTFKFDLAVKMIDHGLIEKALLYIEQIAVNIVKEPSRYKKAFIDSIYTLGDRLKYHDPVCKDSIEDVATLTWLNNLAEIVGKCHAGEIVESEVYGTQVTADPHSTVQDREILQSDKQQWSATKQEYADGPTSMMEIPSNDVQTDWQPSSLPATVQDPYDQTMQYVRNTEEQYQQSQQHDCWSQQSYYQPNYTRNDTTSSTWHPQAHTPYSSDQADVDNPQPQEKWSYEAEREDKTPTPEVSKCTFTPDNTLNPVQPLDTIGVNSLRRRRISTKPDLSPAISRSNLTSEKETTTVFALRATPKSHTEAVKSRKSNTYPKIKAVYPKIPQDNKNLPKDSRRSKKIDPKCTKPPYAHPPVFLKCKVKKKVVGVAETSSSALRKDDRNCTTDLDIQFSNVDLGDLVSSNALLEPERLEDERIRYETLDHESATIVVDKGQSLRQYCNFEEKKVMRVAPHIRRKDLICDTVDAWSYSERGSNELSRYKPLIFGGTYPIDVPVKSQNELRNLRSIGPPIQKHMSKTYDIDVPTSDE